MVGSRAEAVGKMKRTLLCPSPKVFAQSETFLRVCESLYARTVLSRCG